MKSEQGTELFERAIKCAKKAGIYDKMFPAFGTMLGGVRPTKSKEGFRLGFMEHDKDADIGFLPCSVEQKDAYYKYCKEDGLLAMWPHPSHRIRRTLDGEIMWFSIKHAKAVRSCNWFFFEYNGYMWHSKFDRWTHVDKFPEVSKKMKKKLQGVALGAPAHMFKEMVPFEFEGLEMHIPKNYGMLLDYWYPYWHKPHKGGSSKKNRILLIDNWENKSGWKIQ